MIEIKTPTKVFVIALVLLFTFIVVNGVVVTIITKYDLFVEELPSIDDFPEEARACSVDSDCIYQPNKECRTDFAVNKKYDINTDPGCLVGGVWKTACRESVCIREMVE